ncbi:hypothetical protein L6164_032392 [Bauhinia variegata]|uniref:Uncharacterized protein n=1 Tax=Bauhinia variegata TaxID=167791 RepID=A0ACB9KNR0_BAUVA|nr:hypothetical protein L6164_032392 [Bauhinia variegata]
MTLHGVPFADHFRNCNFLVVPQISGFKITIAGSPKTWKMWRVKTVHHGHSSEQRLLGYRRSRKRELLG